MNINENSAKSVQIREMIISKEWYRFGKDGEFLLQASMAFLASKISDVLENIDAQKLQEILINSYSTEVLSRVGSVFFIDSLLEVDPDLVLWSQGDPDWQKLKVVNTKLLDRNIKSIHFIATNKVSHLEKIFISLIDEEVTADLQIVVIDDKESNLLGALKVAEKFVKPGLEISTFHLNLEDNDADPEACLRYLSGIKNKRVKLVVDMDGVLIDTNRVLSRVLLEDLLQNYPII